MKPVVPSSPTPSSGLSRFNFSVATTGSTQTKRLLLVFSRTSLTVNEQIPLLAETTATQATNSALGWLLLTPALRLAK